MCIHFLKSKKKKKMPGKTKTINKIANVLKYILGGLGLVTAFIPGLQPLGALLGATSGAMSLSTGIADMIQQKHDGTLTTANKIGNITNIIGGALGMAGPVTGLIGSGLSGAAQTAANVAKTVISGVGKVNSVIGAAASVPNTISNIFRGRDTYDNYMNLT
jgi:hypothetical protein